MVTKTRKATSTATAVKTTTKKATNKPKPGTIEAVRLAQIIGNKHLSNYGQ